MHPGPIPVTEIGITLAALILRAVARLDRCIDRVEDARQSDVHDLVAAPAELRERMAKLEGLREAVTGRRAA